MFFVYWNYGTSSNSKWMEQYKYLEGYMMTKGWKITNGRVIKEKCSKSYYIKKFVNYWSNYSEMSRLGPIDMITLLRGRMLFNQ